MSGMEETKESLEEIYNIEDDITFWDIVAELKHRNDMDERYEWLKNQPTSLLLNLLEEKYNELVNM